MKNDEKILKAEFYKMKAISDVSQILAKFMQEIFDNGADGPHGVPEYMCQQVLIDNMTHFFGFFARDFDGNINEFENIFSGMVEGLEDHIMESVLAEKRKSDMAMVRGPTPA